MPEIISFMHVGVVEQFVMSTHPFDQEVASMPENTQIHRVRWSKEFHQILTNYLKLSVVTTVVINAVQIYQDKRSCLCLKLSVFNHVLKCIPYGLHIITITLYDARHLNVLSTERSRFLEREVNH